VLTEEASHERVQSVTSAVWLPSSLLLTWGGGVSFRCPYARYFYNQGFFSAKLFDTCFANLVHREVVINSSHNFFSATSLKVSIRFDPRHWSHAVRGMLYSECTGFADRAVQSHLTGFSSALARSQRRHKTCAYSLHHSCRSVCQFQTTQQSLNEFSWKIMKLSINGQLAQLRRFFLDRPAVAQEVERSDGSSVTEYAKAHH
jgi:hypothetical protein